VLRDDEATVGVVQYLLENPIRAGLVARVEEHPYSGSFVYALNDLLQSIARA
jgi:hypothetical protein